MTVQENIISGEIVERSSRPLDAVVSLHGDCLNLLPALASESVDMVLCDLPYGTTACKWDVVIPFEPLWKEYKRICKQNAAIVLFGSLPFTIDLAISQRKLFKYWWIWNKVIAMGFLNAKKQPLRTQEEILVFYEKQPTYNAQLTKKEKKDIRWNSTRYGAEKELYVGLNNKNRYDSRIIPPDMSYPKNIITFSNANNNGEHLHPAQKPVELMEYLIKTYTNENDVVLDNCMGSGTTGVACVNTKRRFIGMEKEEKYFVIASKRIADALNAVSN